MCNDGKCGSCYACIKARLTRTFYADQAAYDEALAQQTAAERVAALMNERPENAGGTFVATGPNTLQWQADRIENVRVEIVRRADEPLLGWAWNAPVGRWERDKGRLTVEPMGDDTWRCRVDLDTPCIFHGTVRGVMELTESEDRAGKPPCRGATVGCHDASCAKEAGHVVLPECRRCIVRDGPFGREWTPCPAHAPAGMPLPPPPCGECRAEGDCFDWCPTRKPKREAKPACATRREGNGNKFTEEGRAAYEKMLLVEAACAGERVPPTPDGDLRKLPDPLDVWNSKTVAYTPVACAKCGQRGCLHPRPE